MTPPRPHARLWFSAVFVLVTIFWTFDLARLHTGVPHPLDDVWEYGVTARHLLAGDGFRTSVLHPPLWGLRDAALTVPVLVHGPLVPLLFAPLLALLGAGALDHVAWLSALFALLTALLLFRVGTRHFGPAVGAAAAMLFTLAPLTVRAVHHDVSALAGAFLMFLVFDLLARERPHHTAAAIVLGLGTLVRPEMPLALAGLSMLAGGMGTVTLLLGIVAVSGAWWWHNWRVTGSPFFNLSSYLLVGYSERWPGISVLRDFALTPARWPGVLAEQTPGLPQKAVRCLPYAVKRALLTPSDLTGWLAAVGFFVSVARASTRWIAVAAFVCALVPVAVMSVMVRNTRYLVPFLALWALSGAVGAEWLWSRIPRVGRSRAWLLLLALLVLPSTVSELRAGAREAGALRIRLAAERAALASRVTPEAALPRVTALGIEPRAGTSRKAPRLMFSDTPDFVAWTTGRPTVWMTRWEYDRLPTPTAARSTGVAPRDSRPDRRMTPGAKLPVEPQSLPSRGGPEDTWFAEGLR